MLLFPNLSNGGLRSEGCQGSIVRDGAELVDPAVGYLFVYNSLSPVAVREVSSVENDSLNFAQ